MKTGTRKRLKLHNSFFDKKWFRVTAKSVLLG